jgi:molybdopterin-guanine dinucleotide biosynthesis protein A
MGRDKALLQRDGKSQLQRAIELLREVTEKQFVSTRTEQQDDSERQRYAQIVDRYEDIGPIAGILSALETHPEVDWLVLACDLPNLDRQTLDHLIEHAAVEKPFTAFRSSHDGLPEPLCAIFRADSAAIIRASVEDGLVCPRKILIRSDTMLLQQPNPAALDNVNTPDDLASSILHAAR